MTNIMNLVNQYGKVVVDFEEIAVNCNTDSDYTNCVNTLINAGLKIFSIDKMDGVTSFTFNDTLIQVSAPYGDDI